MRFVIKPLAFPLLVERRVLEADFQLPVYGFALDINPKTAQEMESNLPFPFPPHLEGSQILVTTPMTLMIANFCASETADSDEKPAGSPAGPDVMVIELCLPSSPDRHVCIKRQRLK
jgi:hypothetical protein